MLYDKRWEKTDPLSLDSLIAWLEKQPPQTEYDYLDRCNCLLGQYLGRPVHLDEEIAITNDDMDILQGYPRTFGAALKRARSAAGR